MSQNGIFAEGTVSSLFQEFLIKDNVEIELLKKTLLNIYKMNSEVLNVVIAFSKNGCNKLHIPSPTELQSFNEIKGINNLKMPSTQYDVFIWAHSDSKSEIVDFSITCNYLLDDYLISKLTQEGFRYHDSRDLTGFVDGSANPKGEDQQKAALIPEENQFEGGSFLLTQKWVHNLKSFHKNKVEEQEKIIGRTKEESIELEGGDMPENSHVSRTDVKVDGEAMKIYRRSFPFANENDHGLYFLGFAKEIKRLSIQLERMVGASDDKISDRIMDFSIPITGSYYYAPSEELLIDILAKIKYKDMKKVSRMKSF